MSKQQPFRLEVLAVKGTAVEYTPDEGWVVAGMMATGDPYKVFVIMRPDQSIIPFSQVEEESGDGSG